MRDLFGVELGVRSLFESPTVAALARRIDAALRGGDGVAATPPMLPAAAGDDSAPPLSFSQERLWFLEQLEPGTGGNNIPAILELRGATDVPALERALAAVGDRHEALRTTFAVVDGQPVQVITPTLELCLPVVDLSGLDDAVAEATATTLAQAESWRPFDLERGPLFRATLVRAAGRRHLLLLAMHHIVSDGWSLGVLVREVAALYEAFAARRPSSPPVLPPLALQYGDFCRWQRRWLQGEVLESHLAFWRRELGGSRPVLELPSDRPRPAVRSSRGAILYRELPPALVAAADRLAAAGGATRFMTLAAGFLALLHRLSGQSDLRLGTFIANRNRSEVEPLIGFFVNNLVLRAEVDRRAGFRRLLDGVRETTLAAYAHQDLPFEALLQELAPERSLSHTPLFQAMFVLQNAPMPPLALPELEIRLLPLDNARSNFDLTLWVEPRQQGLTAALQYSLDLFDPPTAGRMVEQLLRLLAGAAQEPERLVGDLPLLAPAEVHQTLHEWNDTWEDRTGEACVHELLASRAATAPDAVAVADEETSLSYGELNRRANRLAHHLRALGVGPESRVGLLAERSPEMVVGLLGILKAGGAYLPLDPRSPGERLSYMMADAGAGVLVAQERLAAAVTTEAQRILLEDSAGTAAAESDPAGAPDLDGLAYLIYTSGSTGRPKAVAVRHGSLANYTRAAVRRYAMAPEDRVLQFAAISFDASAEEIYPALVTGATLVLRSDRMLGSPAEFLETCGRWGITVLDLPTAYWHELTASLGSQDALPAALRLTILGGERALVERAARWLEVSPLGSRLFNTYGPTEGTIVATQSDLTALAGPGLPRELPIGRAVRNARALVLDREMRPVPPGARGELHLGGAGLARGYLGRPEMTAERFVPDPFAAVPGERLYKTGDLVRLLPTGDLEFAGRTDNQVKLRGYRVELGEIETVLVEHPAVRGAVVLLRQDDSGERYLAAWVACDPAAAPSAAELRELLKGRLPEYMVPTAVTVMEALPLNASGKVEVRALPEPDRSSAGERDGYVAPGTPTEEVLAGLWEQVLNVARVGIHDSFFELGGYSLLATKIVARVRETFSVELPLSAVFETSTVAEMARRIDEASRAEMPPIERVPRDIELPLSFSQERIWFLGQLDPGIHAYHVPRATRLVGAFRPELLERAYTELIRRHEILRTTFPAVDGRPVQRIHPPRPLTLPLIDLTALPEAMAEPLVERLVLEDGSRLFDVEAGPLLRVVLVRLSARHHVVIQTEHHLVHDGWAETVLMRDLLAFYSAFLEGREPDLPELPIQFADFAWWQRQWLSGEVLEGQLSYWRRQLADAPALLELPTDRPRPPVQRPVGDQIHMTLTTRQIFALRSLASRHGATLFITMLAAFETLLHRYRGQDDLALGSVVANRRRYQTEGLLGMILNTLALRTDVGGDPPFSELLERVRQTCVGAYAHQDLPFEKVVEAVRAERNLSHSPLFQVMFAFHDAPHPAAQIEDLSVSAMESHNRSAKFDMLVILAPHEDPVSLQPDEPALGGMLEYNTDLFDAATIARLRDHFEAILDAVIADPRQRLWDVPLLSAAERHQVIGEWSQTGDGGPRDACLHDLLEAQAQRTPRATALVAGDERLTYRELHRRANRLARHLRRLGVGPERRVAVCAERSAELIVGLLAVLKAGGAYVPVDPAYPRERQEVMLADSGALVLLTQGRLAGRLPAATGARVVLLDDAAGFAAESAKAPVVAADAGNLAYVIYTSGSTGRPKGVAIEHASAVSLVRWAREAFEGDELGGVLASTSVCFDLSVFEIFVPLAWGGTVILAENILQLPVLPAACEVRLVNTVPSGIAELIRTGGVPPSVRTVNLAGEPLKRALVQQIHQATAARRVLNLYGPSEDTTYSTFAPVAPEGEQIPPIGQPIAGTRAYVLDRRLRPAPLGIPGELHLAGAGLARGYLDRPDLTAERFLPDAFGGEPGGRMYRTGDLVRRRVAGELEFLGRIDQQVKIRGFRIELGEVEAVLAAHPAVRECAVVVAPDRLGDTRMVAYVVAEGEVPPVAELCDHLGARLPGYMVPAAFVPLAELPRTPNGKLDRRALPDPEPAAQTAQRAPASELERAIAEVWQEVLGLDKVDARANFFDLGGHSLLMVRVHHRLRQVLGRDLSMVEMFKHPTVEALARALGGGEVKAPTPVPGRGGLKGLAGTPDIAIVGMAGRFPGARDVQGFWRNLCTGVESISFFTDAELEAGGIDRRVVREPGYVKAKGVIEGFDEFDAAFFDVGPREAEITDPQHRLFLECVWEALEDAGCDPARYPGEIGVFAGVGTSGYWLNLHSNPDVVAAVGAYQARLVNDKDYLATRVSYKLDLKGPSLNVQTACSTSMVAVHLACRSLVQGECDTALAGAVSVVAQQISGYRYQEGGIHSPDGHCRAFDAGAQGTVGGNGLGVVVLKRLADALADGDHVYAVIRGTAINNDGSVKVGYTAPSVSGQARAIAEAQAVAGVSSATVSYIEAHGTGTVLGDPIEIAALTEVFRPAGAGGVTPRSCALGSVKTNIGHLDAASGMAGLIKTALALHHGAIPPSLNFERPNPGIDFASGPFYVNTELRPWPRGTAPRRAGVSSFGIGGTNAHAVLEEAPPVAPSGSSRPWQLLLLSAKTPTALETAARNLADHLRRQPEAGLADVAYTLQVGRRELGWRRVLVCRDPAAAAAALEQPERVTDALVEPGHRGVVFLLPGQGAQRPGMGLGLYRHEPAFRDHVDRCSELLRPLLGLDLREVLWTQEGTEGAAERLRQTWLAQPALFVVESALAHLWMEWGVRPRALLGHSIGEYVAAYLSGVLGLADALRLVAVRGRLMQEMPPGAMLSVALPESEVAALLAARAGSLSLAAVNGPERCVVAGPEEEVTALAAELERRGVSCKRLEASHAFHSSMVEPVLARFADEVAGVVLGAPQIPFVSNVTGTWIRAEEAADPDYWVRHLRQTVRFADGLGEILREPGAVLLEVGPGRALSSLAGARPDRPAAVVASLPGAGDPEQDLPALLGALGRLWLAGVSPDWQGFHRRERRLRVSLPTYPFERRRYWIEARPDSAAARPERTAPRKRPEIADWFYAPVWRPAPPPAGSPPAASVGWRLLFAGEDEWGSHVAALLRQHGEEVVTVRPGAAFKALEDGGYLLDPADAGQYRSLLRALDARGLAPRRIAHLWGLSPVPPGNGDVFEQVQVRGLYSLLFLAQALAAESAAGDVTIDVLASGVHAVGGEVPVPEKVTILGACKVIPQEYPGIVCRSLDLPAAPPAGRQRDPLLADLIADLQVDPRAAERAVAYRRSGRWAQAFEPLRLEAPAAGRNALRPRGIYLLIGGMGRIGLAQACFLAREAQARLVLTSRSPLPERERWEAWIREHGEDDRVSRRIHSLFELEELGAEVLAVTVDAADLAGMRQVLARTRERFGEPDGVLYLAGVVGEGAYRSVQETGPRECRLQFEAKARGLWVLEEILAGVDLDFCLLASSLSAVLGGLGYAAYAAANLYLDAFVARHNTSPGSPWTSVGWDAWQHEPASPAADNAAEGRLAMSTEEGTEVFRRLLAIPGAGQVVVSTGDLAARLAQWVAPPSAAPALPAATHARPALRTSYAAPESELESAVAELWQQMLGIGRIGLHDDFFELGGDSLLAVQMLSRLRGRFGVDLPLRGLLETPTIAHLARSIDELRQAPRPAAIPDLPQAGELSIEDELEALGQLSDEEVLRLLEGTTGEVMR
ncbi:MAG TPA: amino acid adenylation domain-containing protein [Thermoanaerobaculia bacterium]|nr:amino acid adenylation domain-containing protein [Thermoanaerobaculia bacterium]